MVINCVTSICPVQVKKNLACAGLNNVIPVNELISENGELLSLPWFVSQQREEMNQNLKWLSELYRMLSDDLSKKVLADVLRFRLTADPYYMNDYTVRLRDQYFENFMEYNNETFVDAGGFDGDTTEEFINRYPDYKKVYLFEPSEKNIIAAKKRLRGRRDIDFRTLGLSDSKSTLHFNADAGPASAVTQDEGDTISVVTLDGELQDESISFIKMDLEGWEMNALRGAEETIRKNKPKLAIAVYHAAKDFREIPQYVLNINPEYKVFLRHYTQGWSETVMFFRGNA
jgi:FkbM family methyltransferase